MTRNGSDRSDGWRTGGYRCTWKPPYQAYLLTNETFMGIPTRYIAIIMEWKQTDPGMDTYKRTPDFGLLKQLKEQAI